MPACLLIFKLFSRRHALILHSVFIHSNIFDQKYQKFMFFRLQYAHFWALILVSIKFSRRHVYYFHKFFQQACLFRPARLFCILEYVQQTNVLSVTGSNSVGDPIKNLKVWIVFGLGKTLFFKFILIGVQYFYQKKKKA